MNSLVLHILTSSWSFEDEFFSLFDCEAIIFHQKADFLLLIMDQYTVRRHIEDKEEVFGMMMTFPISCS